jgi:hypothetical protein
VKLLCIQKGAPFQRRRKTKRERGNGNAGGLQFQFGEEFTTI